MFYSIRHVTRFRYSAPVYESVMELRMQPRSEGTQRTYSFNLAVQPRARIYSYRDSPGNMVHYFDIPEDHRELAITAEALVQLEATPEPAALSASDWELLAPERIPVDAFEMLLPSHFAHPVPLLGDLEKAIGAERRSDPLTLLKELNESISRVFEYKPQSTRVDSGIDEALANRRGVCQDFAHIFIAILRNLRIPARYVSGYLFHGDEPRAARGGATHAWIEAWLPGLGWTGFDPTNSRIASDRHIRTAIGRDYADVPPTRGVLKGEASSKLTVSVVVRPSEVLPPEHEMIAEQTETEGTARSRAETALEQAQQQQQ